MKKIIKVLLCIFVVMFLGFKTFADEPNSVPTTHETGYTLKEVSTPGPNVITKYEYNEETQELTVKFYLVELNKTEYGNGNKTVILTTPKEIINGSTFSVNYKYKDTYGTGSQKVQVTTQKNVGTNPLTFTYLYDESNFDNVYTQTITEEYTKGGSYSDYMVVSENIINNPGNTTINNALFINNEITINFKQNDSSAINLYLCGGLINNQGTISKITSDFVNNRVSFKKTGSYANLLLYGGLIGNYATNNKVLKIGDGGLISNYAYSAQASSPSSSSVTLGNIRGDFIGNHVSATGSTSSSICGGLIGNYAYSYSYFSSSSSSCSSSSSTTIGNITGDFIANNISTSNSSISGGLIYNYSSHIDSDSSKLTSTATIRKITGDFIANYISSGYFGIHGGLIYNRANIDNIIGNFIGNYVSATGSTSNMNGGLINNQGTISKIASDFVGNYISSNDYVKGGIIYNATGNSQTANSSINNMAGNFINNSIYANNSITGGVIYNSSCVITRVQSLSDKVYKNGDVNNKITVYEFNYLSGKNASKWINYSKLPTTLKNNNQYITLNPAVTNTYKCLVLEDSVYNSLTSAQKQEYVNQGKAYSTGYIFSQTQYQSKIGSYATNNSYWSTEDLADYIDENIIIFDDNSQNAQIIFTNAQFINNYAISAGESKGAVLWTNSNVTFNADGGISEFVGNYVQIGSNAKDYQAIWVDSNTATITLNAQNKGTITLNDGIDGVWGYGLHLATILSSEYGMEHNGRDRCKSKRNQITVNEYRSLCTIWFRSTKTIPRQILGVRSSNDTERRT